MYAISPFSLLITQAGLMARFFPCLAILRFHCDNAEPEGAGRLDLTLFLRSSLVKRRYLSLLFSD
jgi:hypothetical protein